MFYCETSLLRKDDVDGLTRVASIRVSYISLKLKQSFQCKSTDLETFSIFVSEELM